MDQQYQLFQDFLRVEVPKEIQAVLNRGGVNDRDWAWLKQDVSDDRNDHRPMNILMRADEYLLYPKDAETHSIGLKVFRKAVTILAFVPSGIRLCGLHFSIDLPGFVEREEWYFSPAEWAYIDRG